MRILQLITGLDYGGAEKVVLDLCTGLQSSGYKVYVVSLSAKKAMLPLFEENNIPVEVLHIPKNPFSFLMAVRSILDLIKREKIELMHTHMFHASVFGSIIRTIRPGIPVVFTPHSTQFGSKLREFILFLTRSLRTRDILFSKSHHRLIFKNSFEIIPNGIALPSKINAREKFDPFTFLAIGRLEKMKNHLALIPMAEKLKANNRRFQILIAGEGPMRKDLERAISQKGLGEYIKLLGFRSDVAELCKKSHVFILPSLWEGLPISLLEAGSFRLPVITTPVGSISSLVDQHNGFIGDTDQFYNFMKESMENYPETQKKADLLFHRIKEEYSLEKFVEKHISLYLSLLK